MCTQCGQRRSAGSIEGGVHAMHSRWEAHGRGMGIPSHRCPQCLKWNWSHGDAVGDTPRMAVRSALLLQLLSQEGVTQGDPLSMVYYGIGILSLLRMLWISICKTSMVCRWRMLCYVVCRWWINSQKSLQTFVLSLSDFSNSVPTTDTSQNRRRAS